ncbi:DUF664 domain-containing protein [Raineyella sp. LH-20]|uniref:mycothiol transferase n=1 Tax=Raineyella sp. LH-20 TaxID=3081204 RepID=UPI00295404FF|nr:DUF664 domain-containing protein [Raineyella sp. LH-20]WOP18140.1 DUF664 domain-containing protein [Raineyella sp. LH-20]
MTENQRTSRTAGEPARDGRTDAADWADNLDVMREEIIAGVLALPLAERRVSRLPSGWSPIELLSHVLHMERRWFVWGFLGEQVTAPWGDWNVDDPAAGPGANGVAPRWTVDEDATAESLVSDLRHIGARTRAVLTSHALDARAHIGGRFTDDPPTLGWICFHVLVEYARHAGQFDVVRELAATAV